MTRKQTAFKTRKAGVVKHCFFVVVFFAEGVSLLNGADGFIFHQPYYKLVMKSFARLLLNDFLADHDPDYKGRYAGLEAFRLVCGHLVGPE